MHKDTVPKSKKTFSFCPFSAVLTFLFLLFPQQELIAQLIPGTTSEQKEQVLPEWPDDPLDRRNPRGTVSGFISAVADRDYDKAGEYFNMKAASVDKSGAEIAQLLENLLNRGGQILPYSLISSDSSGKIEDDLPPNLDRVGSFAIEGEEIDLFVEEKKGPDGGPIWLFSSETIEVIEDYEELGMGALLIDEILPEFLLNKEWGGVPVGHWFVMIVLAFLCYAVVWAIIRGIRLSLPLVWKSARKEPTAGILKAFALPLRLYSAVWLFVSISQEVGISIIVRQLLSRTTLVIGFLAFLILLWRLTELFGAFGKERMTTRGNASGVSVILFLKRAAKIAIVVLGVIMVLGAFGVDVTTGLAALGIGGLALALGAQKTIENFVGSVTLITDQPIRVGDFCKVGDTTGVVEKIGMRSTRIRTLNRTLVTIPNGEFSSSKIENYAHRDKFLFNPVFTLRYETTPEQLRFLLVELRAVLYAHPLISEDPARVRFVELASDSINLEVFAYITVLTYDDYLEVKEDILLRMIDVIGESGTGFAFPSQTIYFSRDSGLSKEKTKKAEEKVKQWREKDELQIPKFDPEKVEELKGKADYPPKGSYLKRQSGGDKIPGL